MNQIYQRKERDIQNRIGQFKEVISKGRRVHVDKVKQKGTCSICCQYIHYMREDRDLKKWNWIHIAFKNSTQDMIQICCLQCYQKHINTKETSC